MSYNNHYGGPSSNSPPTNGSSRDRDRDRPRDRERDRDRTYYPRYSNPQKRFGSSSSYQDQQPSGGYRRQDNREYYGYRGNYGRSNNGSGSGGGNNGLNLNSRRRNDDKYDSYQGSKYRPSNRGKGGPSSGQSSRSPPYNGTNNDYYDHDSYYNKKPYEDRYDRGDDQTHESLDDRRKPGRRSDRDNLYPKHRNLQSRGQRDHYKPDSYNRDEQSESSSRLDHHASADRAERSSQYQPETKSLNDKRLDSQDIQRDENTTSDKPEGDDTAKPDTHKPEGDVKTESSGHAEETTLDFESKSTNQLSDSRRPNDSKPDHEGESFKRSTSTQSPAITDEKLLRLFDDPEEPPSAAEDKAEKSKDDSQSKSPAPPAENTEPTEPEAQQEISETTDDVKLEDSKRETHDDDELNAPDSPVAATADTSVLSPVVSPVSTIRVMRELADIAEHASSPPADEDISDTDTVVAESSQSLNLAKNYLRKERPDEQRRRIKRSVIFDDEDDESGEENTGAASLSNASSRAPSVSSETKNTRVGLPGARENSRYDRNSVNGSDSNESDASSELETEGRDSSKGHSRKKDYKIKRDSTGRSFLQRACKKGDLNEVQELIERGANPNESDFGGFTCLHEAALAGHTDIVEYLIEQGANVNKQALEFGDYETPLMDAAENKHVETVKMLLKHGADPDICNADGYSALTKLYHLNTDDDYKDIISLLDAASGNGRESSLQALSLSPRKIVEDPTETHFNDLVRKKSSATIFKYLAQGLKEAAAGDFVTHAYSLQKTPDILNVAARNGHVEMVDILLGLNPGSFDINQKNRVGVTVLLASVGRGHYDVVKFLLSKGADPKIKREKDGLNALQIAKHSAQHDPREVLLLERYLNGRGPSESKTPQPQPQPQPKLEHNDESGADDMDVDDIPPKLTERKRRASDDHTGKSKKAKTKDLIGKSQDTAPKREEEEQKEPSKADSKDQEVNAETSERASETQQLQESPKSKKHAFDEESRDNSPAAELAEMRKQKIRNSTSISPGPLSKAQEELRLKAAEEAKIWQEKVLAKKRARKEMFLLAEKEKEKKRKEDEEKKIEEMKQQKEKEIEEKIKEAQEAQRLAAELEKKRSVMETKSIIQKYPIGLQEASFDGTISDNERLKFAPLYVLNHQNDDYVIDLQIALLLASPVSELHKHCKSGVPLEVSTATKQVLWPLFFPMVGVGSGERIEKDGCDKFKLLKLHYLKLSDVASFVKELYPEVESLIWRSGKLAKVNLDVTKPEAAPAEPQAGPTKPAKISFIPPKWRHRLDVLRTIQSANTPLW